MAFDISQQVNVVNPAANVDYYYGPHKDVAAACTAVPFGVRDKGKTVGILTDDGVVEYWWKNGVADSDLIVKTDLIILDDTNIIAPVADSDRFYLNIEIGQKFIWKGSYKYWDDGMPHSLVTNGIYKCYYNEIMEYNDYKLIFCLTTPYISEPANAVNVFPSEVRYIGMNVNTADGEYWFKDGIADEDFVIKSESTSKIIHVINNNDILLLEDENGEYYNRIKNLVVGDLFLWDDYAYTYYYDGTGTKSIQFERNCVYRIIPFDSFPKIERIDLRPNFDEHIVDSINRVDDETPNRIVKLLASCESEYDWDVDEVGKLDGVRISIVQDGSTTTRSLLLDYPLLFKVADGNYKQLYGDDGYVSDAMIKVVTPSSNGLMSASDKSKLDNIPEGGAKGEDGKDGTFTHSYNEDTQTLSFSNTPLDSLTTIKIDVTKLIYDYLDGNISGDGEFMEYSAIVNYINVSEEKFIYIIKNLISNIVFLEIKDNAIEDDSTQHLNYFSQITNMEISGDKDLDNGLVNISAVIDLTTMYQTVDDIPQALLVFKVAGVEPLNIRWYIEIIRNN